MLSGSYRDALNAIPADIARDDWVAVGMAAHAAGLSESDWIDWSSGADSFKESDARSVWRSFSPGKVTAGSLIHYAKHHGWKPQRETHLTLNAVDLWARCRPAPKSHPYIDSKAGSPDELRVCEERLIVAGQDCSGALVVPVRTLDGELISLQLIPVAGRKVNLPKHPMRGVFVVGSLGNKAFVVEGVGQAWACNQASGIAAVVSFGAGRLRAVAEQLKERSIEPVLVPDVGQEERCRKIAADLGIGVVCLPPSLGDNGDANDFAQQCGKDALRDMLSKPERHRSRFHPMSVDELLELPALSWRVKGVLPADGLCVVFGPSGSGKSFLVLDMLAAIAKGQDWFGYRVKLAPVVYLALEGEAGIAQRLRAFADIHGKPDLRVITTPLDIRSDEDRLALVASVKESGCAGGVLVVDTLNRAAPAADENSPGDMGSIVQALTELRAALGGVVLAVHHSGKDGSKGMRGHSSLHAALDAAIEVSSNAGGRTWKVAKSKDGADGAEHGFRLRSVLLGADQDGDPISSCVVEESTESQPVRTKRDPQGPNQRIAMRAIQDELKGAKGEEAKMPLDDAIDVIGAALPVESKRKRERAQAALTGLQGSGHLAHKEGFVWIP